MGVSRQDCWGGGIGSRWGWEVSKEARAKEERKRAREENSWTHCRSRFFIFSISRVYLGQFLFYFSPPLSLFFLSCFPTPSSFPRCTSFVVFLFSFLPWLQAHLSYREKTKEDFSLIHDSLKANLVCSSLNDSEIDALAVAMQFFTFKKGDLVTKQGEPGNHRCDNKQNLSNYLHRSLSL